MNELGRSLPSMLVWRVLLLATNAVALAGMLYRGTPGHLQVAALVLLWLTILAIALLPVWEWWLEKRRRP